MKKTITIATREFRSYFFQASGYVFAGLLILIANWMFFADLFLIGQADLGPWLSTVIFLFSIFIPAISMGLLAEERKSGTWEVLLTLPVSESEIVWGKLIGSGLFLVFTLALSIPVVATLIVLGRPDVGIMAASFVGIIMLGVAYLATGLAISSVSRQPMVGFLGTAAVLLINNLMGQEILTSRLPVFFAQICQSLSLASRMRNFTNGLISVSDIVFLVSWTVAAVIIATTSLKMRDK